MAKKTKKGKTRLDKFYQLAKEQGYRSRAAFKLIQINRKYDFLSKAKVVLDLCAAPGGWLQVASKYAPLSSIIIGVDLDPIKPIPRCQTLTEDITTTQCRTAIKRILHHFKADVVLHDGAPNVGAAWVQDAYSQADLVLKSLKLATDFLAPNGIFVTKVFRSQDYNKLMWVFNQFFDRVEATKPPSSRNTSAEIFVVCQRYKNPSKIDPRLLDSKYVFADVDTQNGDEKRWSVDDLVPKKKRKAVGYDDGASVLFRRITAASFITSADPISLLADATEITFSGGQDEDEIKMNEQITQLDVTSPEIRDFCADLKVLGKGEFKSILRWRKEARLATGLQKAPEAAKEKDDKANESDADTDDEIARAEDAMKRRERRKKKKEREEKRKNHDRITLNMKIPGDRIDFAEDEELFALKTMKSAAEVEAVEDADPEGEQDELSDELSAGSTSDSGSESDDSGSDIDGTDDDRTDYFEEMNRAFEAQHEEFLSRSARRRKRHAEAEAQKRKKGRRETASGSEGESEGDDDGMVDLRTGERIPRPDLSREVLSDSDEAAPVQSSGADSDAESLSDDDGEVAAGESDESAESSEDEVQDFGDEKPKIGSLRASKNPLLLQEERKRRSAADVWFASDEFAELDSSEDEDELIRRMARAKQKNRGAKAKSADVDEKASNEFEVVKRTEDTIGAPGGEIASDSDDDDDGAASTGQIAAEMAAKAQDKDMEALAMAKLMLRKKTREKLIDDSYNRYAFNEAELPSWFSMDEERHNKAALPLTKEAVEAIRQRMRDINARPIKKVLEAKARKKRRATKKLERMKTKANEIAESNDLSDGQKLRAIRKLYTKAAGTTKKETRYVVSRSASKSKVRVTAGGARSGKIKFVDRRMRADLRKKKNEKKKGKKGR